MQTTLTTMVRMFKRVGLHKNLGRTKKMVFTTRLIWVQQGVAAYKRRATGEGATFWQRKITKVSCTECGGTMAESSLCHHMEISHGIVLPHTRREDVGGGSSETYVVSLLRILKSVECPVEGCSSRANNPGRLREHFMYCHWKAKVAIVKDTTP